MNVPDYQPRRGDAPRRIVLASRGSKLALRQAEIVTELITRSNPSLEVETRVVTTKGDTDRRAFASIGGRGLFTSEVEQEVVSGAADIAVHSAKDLTAELAQGCTILCVPGRADAADVVVGGRGRTGAERLSSLTDGARVGTSSMRRRALLAEVRPDLDLVDLRGNLDTRLAKVRDGEVDAAIVAAAGVERLALKPPRGSLDPSWWVPAPAQGALAVEGLTARRDLVALLAPLEDPAARAAIDCERAFSRTLEGGCSVPLGCYATADGDRLVVTGFLGDPDGLQAIRDRISGPMTAAAALGEELARAILDGGGADLLAETRDRTAPIPGAP